MTVEVMIEDDRWHAAAINALAERAACATLEHLGLDHADHAIAVLACDDARIAALNGDFRGRAQATNVLSWPGADRGATIPGARPALPVPDPDDPDLGDIAIAYDTCAHEAAEAGRPLVEHATHLVVHAVLHLLGYDHERDADATLMETTEAAILGKLGIADPY